MNPGEARMASFGIVSQNTRLENGLVDGDLLVVREGAIWGAQMRNHVRRRDSRREIRRQFLSERCEGGTRSAGG